jgi:hypothetical protein
MTSRDLTQTVVLGCLKLLDPNLTDYWFPERGQVAYDRFHSGSVGHQSVFHREVGSRICHCFDYLGSRWDLTKLVLHISIACVMGVKIDA